MTRPSAASLTTSLSLAGVLASSCVDIPDLPDPVIGHQWCLDAELATGRRLPEASPAADPRTRRPSALPYSPPSPRTRATSCFKILRNVATAHPYVASTPK